MYIYIYIHNKNKYLYIHTRLASSVDILVNSVKLFHPVGRSNPTRRFSSFRRVRRTAKGKQYSALRRAADTLVGFN